MTEDRWENIAEEEFETVLRESVPPTPPDAVAKGVTPWRRAVRRVLFGMTMNLITLNFLNLNSILPGIGLLLCLVGFRALRKENKWFCACFFLTILKCIYYLSETVFKASIYRENIYQTDAMQIAAAANVLVLFLLCICLWNGFQTVRKKSGQSVKMGAAAALPFWCFLLLFFSFLNSQGSIVPFIMLVAYGLIIRSFFRLAKQLEAAGYVIRPALVRVPNAMIGLGFIGIIAGGILCNWIFFNRYPMEWEKVQKEEFAGTAQEEKIREIKEDLLARGFPEDVLGDLTEDELRECGGALRIYSRSAMYPVEGVERKYQYEGAPGQYYYAYDKKELCITQVAVELAGEPKRWKIIHHFHWMIDPGFYGTESIQLWPTWHHEEEWEQEGGLTGRVLYEKGKDVYTAPYYSFDEISYVRDSFLFAGGATTDVFVAFSVPKNAHNCRAYIAYNAIALKEGGSIDSWVFYTHQKSYFQYPAVTAMQHRMTRGMTDEGAFKTIHTALQIHTDLIPE